MKKTAIFVEGKAERIFIQTLLQFIGEKHQYLIDVETIGGGRKCKIYTMKSQKIQNSHSPNLYFLLVDCSNDERVISYLSDQYDSLIEAGYENIVALRDLYPKKVEDKIALIRTIYECIKNDPVEPLIVISVLEIEAWFIAEYTHFEKINPQMDIEFIKNYAKIDPTQNTESIEHPFNMMKEIYKTAGETYEKTDKSYNRTINSLDMQQYFSPNFMRAPSINPLLERLGLIFS